MLSIEGYPDNREITARTLNSILVKTKSYEGLINYIGYVNPQLDKLVIKDGHLMTAGPVSIIQKQKFIFANQIQYVSKLPTSKHILLYISRNKLRAADPAVAKWGLINFWRLLEPKSVPDTDFDMLTKFIDQCCLNEKCLDSVLFSIWSSLYDGDETHEGVSVVTFNMVTRDILESNKNCMLGTTLFTEKLFNKFKDMVLNFIWPELWRLNAVSELEEIMSFPNCEASSSLELLGIVTNCEPLLWYGLTKEPNYLFSFLTTYRKLTSNERTIIAYKLYKSIPLSYEETVNICSGRNENDPWSESLFTPYIFQDNKYYEFLQDLTKSLSKEVQERILTRTQDDAMVLIKTIYSNTESSKYFLKLNLDNALVSNEDSKIKYLF